MIRFKDDPEGPIAPAPRFRTGRPARCRWRDCDRPATHYPAVSLWAKGWPAGSHEPIRLVIECPLCRSHARKPAWLTETVRGMIEKSAEAVGKAPPDFESAKIAPVSIREGAHPYTRHPRD